MRHLFILISFLISFAASAKDHGFENYYMTEKYLSRQAGETSISKEKFREMFADYYSRPSVEKHFIFFEQDGDVSINHNKISRGVAEKVIDDIASDGNGIVVLLIGGGYSGKSEKSYKSVSKHIYNMIEARTARGINYDDAPVLVNSRNDFNDICSLTSRPLKNITSKSDNVAEVAIASEPETENNVNTPKADMIKEDKATATTSFSQKSGSTHAEETKSVAADTEELTSYIVRVETSLSVRKSPSASAKKIGTLANNEHIEVANIDDNGWAKIRYDGSWAYVKSDYIEPNTTISTSFSYGSGNGFWDFLLHVTPVVIVILSILLLKLKGSGIFISGICLGVIEILYAAAATKCPGLDDTLPWFCTPGKVGWIWTIIDFILLCGVLVIQHNFFKQFMINIINESRRGGFFTIATYILSYPIAAIMGILMMVFFVNIQYFWVPVLAFGVLWVIMKWAIRESFTDVLPQTIILSVMFGGMLVFFLKTAGVIIIVGIAYILLRAIGEGSSSSSSSSSSPTSSSTSMSSVKSHGNLERDAFGGLRVRHGDGSTTDVTDYGGEITDNSGKRWRGGFGGNLDNC